MFSGGASVVFVVIFCWKKQRFHWNSQNGTWQTWNIEPRLYHPISYKNCTLEKIVTTKAETNIYALKWTVHDTKRFIIWYAASYINVYGCVTVNILMQALWASCLSVDSKNMFSGPASYWNDPSNLAKICRSLSWNCLSWNWTTSPMHWIQAWRLWHQA